MPYGTGVHCLPKVSPADPVPDEGPPPGAGSGGLSSMSTVPAQGYSPSAPPIVCDRKFIREPCHVMRASLASHRAPISL
ncbi:hypothetical protein GCM10009549_07950 [Streptomyces thermoalcalitolerans]|uniref:Uncharacterized protein n=1 Tax=Streptomyces thermoalcalitolerans TaxID=65605 RepID=A0ABN1NEM2_9ACTN